MALTLDRLRAPKPAEAQIVYEGEELHITYDRAAFTVELVEGVYSMPIRQRLVQVLLYWDLLRDGQPWVPEGRDDPIWRDRARDLRVMRAVAEKGEPLTDTERGAVREATPTVEECQAAYRAAWDAILVQLPREFVRTIDGGILDDFLGVSWRGAASANGSAQAASMGGGHGGTTTPIG
jgi:hypothetical protein